MLSSRTEFFNGVKAELPILLGVLPFGMIYGVLALQAGLPPALALAMSSIVFAGSSQFIGTQLMAQGAGGFVIIATTFVVNLRHALYSASVAPFIKHVPLRWKVLLAYLLTDEAYAVTITRFTQPDSRHGAQQALVLLRGGDHVVVVVADQHGDRHLRRPTHPRKLEPGLYAGADVHRAGRAELERSRECGRGRLGGHHGGVQLCVAVQTGLVCGGDDGHCRSG